MSINKKVILLFTFLYCIFNSSYAGYKFRHVDSRDGLSNNQIRSILSAPDGRLIIKTEGMINFYDATNFRLLHYNTEKAYRWNYSGIEKEYIDQQDRLWVKERGRLLIFDLVANSFLYNVQDILQEYGVDKSIKDVFIDDSYNFWFLTDDDDLLLHDGQKTTKTIIDGQDENERKFGELQNIVEHRDGLYFLFYWSGWVRMYNMSSGKFVHEDCTLVDQLHSSTNRYFALSTQNNKIFVLFNGDKGGLWCYDVAANKWENWLGTKDYFTSMTLDSQDCLWVSGKTGTWIIDTDSRKIDYLSIYELIDSRQIMNDINALYADKQGGVWLGTFNKGLLYYHPSIQKFKLFDAEDLPSSLTSQGDVRCFMEDDNGDILVGTIHGLVRYNPKNGEFKPYGKGLDNCFCLHLYRDRTGIIWLSTLDEGIFSIEGDKVTNYRSGEVPFGIRENNIRFVHQASNGDYYISAGKIGMGRFSSETGRFRPFYRTYPELIQFGMMTHAIPLTEDTLLVGAQNGLFLLDTDSRQIRIPNVEENPADSVYSHSNRKYNCIFKDSRELIWFGTQDGLNVWNTKTGTKHAFYVEQGLANNCIQTIIEDRKGNIWVTTSNGISRVRLIEEKQEFYFSFVNFNYLDGLQEGEFYERSALLSTEGKLYFGGTEGFNEVDPENIQFGIEKYQPVFVGLRLFNTEVKVNEPYKGDTILTQSITRTTRLNLPYNKNFITLDFSALNFINPTQTYYRYKLDGFDIDWTEIHATDGIGRVTYTGLPPGYYTFKVYATDNSKEWDGGMTQLSIRIRPPFWATPLAYFFYLLTIIFVLAFVMIGFLKYSNNKIRKKHEEENRRQKEKLDEMKFRFFTNVSHEFRTPLTLILTPLESLQKQVGDENPILKKQLSVIYKSAQGLLSLVNQLLDFQKIEQKAERLKLSYSDMKEFMDLVYLSFQDIAIEKGIAFNIEQRKLNIYMYFDKDKMYKVMNNLLSNAFKFTPSEGIVNLHVGTDIAPASGKMSLSVSVADTGIGIGKKDIRHIFDRFYQVDNPDYHTGSGIGLHIVKEYVSQHGGEVYVSSTEGEGSVFTVYIPLDLQPDSSSVHQKSLQEPEVEIQADKIETSLKNKDKLTLLVVEDNTEFREFLQDELSGKYNILTAVNGKEGYETILEKNPDLVISDIMMPVMDGIELCRTLKADIRISHIPVILLTAKTSDENKLIGYEAGADAYVPKPFNMDILLLRIANLIEQRNKRIDSFNKNIEVNPVEVTITSLDQKLVQKALECVEKNIDNPEYSVKELSENVGMDRTHLYRKLQSIVGQTPTEFIRMIRLKRAAQLLEKSQLTVSEVAMMVGFNEPKYFRKYFKETFGMNPSDYASAKNKPVDI